MSTTPAEGTQRGTARPSYRHGGRSGVNWVLALLTIPGAIAIVGFAYLQVMGTAACTSGACSGTGPDEDTFGLILYGVPVVAVVAVVLSFFTARRRLGFVVPLIAWVLFAVATVILVVSF